jgi:hypothetical protein
MYNPELMKQASKHKIRLKSLHSIIESLLNQSYNKYSRDIICIESYKESLSYIFLLIFLETAQKTV